MNLTQDQIAQLIKSVLGILSAIGIVIDPKWALEITTGFFVMYSLVQSIRVFIAKKKPTT